MAKLLDQRKMVKFCANYFSKVGIKELTRDNVRFFQKHGAFPNPIIIRDNFISQYTQRRKLRILLSSFVGKEYFITQSRRDKDLYHECIVDRFLYESSGQVIIDSLGTDLISGWWWFFSLGFWEILLEKYPKVFKVIRIGWDSILKLSLGGAGTYFLIKFGNHILANLNI